MYNHMDLAKFNITGNKEYVLSLKSQNERLIQLRWLYITLLPFVAAATSYITGDSEFGVTYFYIGLAGVAVNSLMFILCKVIPLKSYFFQSLMVIQIGFDLFFATVATYVTGGLDARTTAVYAVPIVASGLIFSARIVYFTAAASGLGYILAVIADIMINHRFVELSEVFVPLVFYPVLFILLARLTHYLMKLSVQATEEKVYESFLSLLSHQLKHPLSTTNAILDTIDYYEEKGLSHKKHKKFIQQLKSENQNMMLLLNNLLEAANQENKVYAHETTDLPKLLQQIAYHCAERNSRVDDLKLHLGDISTKIVANSDKLKTALYNIINNAFMFSDKGSNVEIDLQDKEDTLVVSIVDHGGGMNWKNKQTMFKKFSVSTDDNKGIQGLGLGLYVAKKIIHAHSGIMHVISRGSGTKVIIILKKGKT